MSTSVFKCLLAILGGLLIAAAPASAQQGDISRDTLSDHSAITAAEPKTLSCELMAVGPAGAHGAGAGITYNGHAGLGASYNAASNGTIELINVVTDNKDPDTMAASLLSGAAGGYGDADFLSRWPARLQPSLDGAERRRR